MLKNHQYYLELAINQAKNAFELGNVAIGAVLVSSSGEILAEGANEIKTTFDATAHAEVLTIRKAGKKALTKYNPEPTILYTTLEPCFACSFFVTRTNIKTIVWALNDPYRGGVHELKVNDKLKDDFAGITLVSEPDSKAKEDSKRLMVEYNLSKGDTERAEFYKNL